MSWPPLSAYFKRVSEKNCTALLAIIFIILALLISAVPYDPSTDLADATTNDIWIEHYSHGVYHIPWSEWTNNQTQSVVVEYQGEYVVVNEKGPGHVMAMVPFRALGLESFFAYTMAGLAVLGTYMLGKRLFSWPVGFIAALFVMFNLSVVVMWHRYYWTDASTMHFLVFSVWLFIEGIYRYNGNSLDPKNVNFATWKEKGLGLGLGILAGFFFGMSVSTRYATALIIVIFPLFIMGFYLIRIWADLKSRKIMSTVKRSMPALLQLAVFTLGLLIVLVPLMQYNTAYFGGLFNSGYDATLVFKFNPATRIDPRNTSTVWTGDLFSYVSTALGNLLKLTPMFLSRMPALIFLPIGLYCLRKKRIEMAMLCAWIGINFYTYLSLNWVDMYARTDLMPWEPRYWMPSLPAIALVGGLGIYRLSAWLAKKMDRKDWKEVRVGRILIAGALAGALLLFSAVPSMQYIADPPTASPGPRPPGGGGQLPIPVQLVTTDQLVLHPDQYLDSQVLVENATMMSVSNNSIIVRSPGSADSVTLRFVDWPPGTLPQFHVGQNVTVRGMFNRAPAPPGVMPSYFIGVKYSTQDFVRVMP